jgi:predicted PurR-regulated permease PerM
VALAALLISCYFIIEPFVALIVWASVLSISLNPLFLSLKKLFRGKGGLAATVITVLFMLLLIAPIVWMSISTGMSLQSLGEEVKSGELAIPPPNESVKSFPLVGNTIYNTWSLASTNMEQLITQYKTQLITGGTFVAGLIASTGKGILLLALAIIVSGFLLAFGKPAGSFARAFFVRLAGERGREMAMVAEVTVRNVTKGILGVAFIQSLLAGAGMFIAGVPLAGLWTLFCLILAAMQIGLLPVSLGVIIWAWLHLSTFGAILLTAWMAFVGVVDNILKPILLGRKAPVPMLVVFLGAIGGFISSGFIGLFTGAIILSLGYKLMISWVYGQEVAAQS